MLDLLRGDFSKEVLNPKCGSISMQMQRSTGSQIIKCSQLLYATNCSFDKAQDEYYPRR